MIDKATFPLSYTTEIILDTVENHLDVEGAFYIVDDFFYTRFRDKINDRRTFWFKANENNKSLATAQAILNKLSLSNLKRNDTIVAIGGGLTLDIAAFCASIYKRGCRLCFIPTTIIGMIDASIGGKTGLNHDNLKNLFGTFYPANRVILDFDLLQTLPVKEVKNGYAELLKMMIISDRDFFEHDFDTSEYLQKAIKYKLQICESDLMDRGIRQHLNLGHTFAHLFETISDFNISHGDAVAKGIVLTLRLSLEKQILSQKNYDRIVSCFYEHCNIVCFSDEEIRQIKNRGKEILNADKKNDKHVKLVLINDSGVEFWECEDVDGLVEFILSNELAGTSPALNPLL